MIKYSFHHQFKFRLLNDLVLKLTSWHRSAQPWWFVLRKSCSPSLVCDSLYWCVPVYLEVLNLFSKGFFKSEKSVSFIVWVVGGISGSLKCNLFVLVCDKKWAEHLKHASSYLWSLRTPAQDNSSPYSQVYLHNTWNICSKNNYTWPNFKRQKIRNLKCKKSFINAVNFPLVWCF